MGKQSAVERIGASGGPRPYLEGDAWAFRYSKPVSGIAVYYPLDASAPTFYEGGTLTVAAFVQTGITASVYISSNDDPNKNWSYIRDVTNTGEPGWFDVTRWMARLAPNQIRHGEWGWGPDRIKWVGVMFEGEAADDYAAIRDIRYDPTILTEPPA